MKASLFCPAYWQCLYKSGLFTAPFLLKMGIIFLGRNKAHPVRTKLKTISGGLHARQTVPCIFSSCNLYRRSAYFEEQCHQFREKRSQKLNSIDNGRAGVIPNHGNALKYVSCRSSHMVYTCSSLLSKDILIVLLL